MAQKVYKLCLPLTTEPSERFYKKIAKMSEQLLTHPYFCQVAPDRDKISFLPSLVDDNETSCPTIHINMETVVFNKGDLQEMKELGKFASRFNFLNSLLLAPKVWSKTSASVSIAESERGGKEIVFLFRTGDLATQMTINNFLDLIG